MSLLGILDWFVAVLLQISFILLILAIVAQVIGIKIRGRNPVLYFLHLFLIRPLKFLTNPRHQSLSVYDNRYKSQGTTRKFPKQRPSNLSQKQIKSGKQLDYIFFPQEILKMWQDAKSAFELDDKERFFRKAVSSVEQAVKYTHNIVYGHAPTSMKSGMSNLRRHGLIKETQLNLNYLWDLRNEFAHMGADLQTPDLDRIYRISEQIIKGCFASEYSLIGENNFQSTQYPKKGLILPEELEKTLDTIKKLVKKSRRDTVTFSMLYAIWNRTNRQNRITLPILLSRVKRLQSLGFVEIISSRSSTTLLGQINIRKSSIRLLNPIKD